MKKGQAALEFLSTYGFAFLIILVMIGALSYFGVLSPNKLIPQRCSFPADVNCFEYMASIVPLSSPNQANLTFVLINQKGNGINFNNTPANSSTATSQFGKGNCSFSQSSQIISGARVTVSCVLSEAPTSGVLGFPGKGEKVKFGIDLQFNELGQTYWQPLRGEILATLS